MSQISFVTMREKEFIQIKYERHPMGYFLVPIEIINSI